MPDYRMMYQRLLAAQEEAMDELAALMNKLEEARKRTEEMYVDAGEPSLFLLRSGKNAAGCYARNDVDG